MSDVAIVAVLGVLANVATYLLCRNVITVQRSLLAEERKVTLDLLARLATRDPLEYRLWGGSGAESLDPQEPQEPQRIYDDTGLLSVPAEDRLED